MDHNNNVNKNNNFNEVSTIDLVALGCYTDITTDRPLNTIQWFPLNRFANLLSKLMFFICFVLLLLILFLLYGAVAHFIHISTELVEMISVIYTRGGEERRFRLVK